MNKIELIELEEFNCKVGHIYSVAVDGADQTLYDLFLEENEGDYRAELGEIANKLNTMSSRTGFAENFFKLNEGKPGDGVCALTDLKGKLRLYCIRFGNILLVLGGGGPKSKLIRAYEEDPKLLSENLMIREVSNAMAKAIREKDLILEEDGSLSGDVIIELDNQ